MTVTHTDMHMHIHTIILSQGFSSWHDWYLVLENPAVAGFSVYYRIFDRICIIYGPDASSSPNKQNNVLRHYLLMPGDPSQQASHPPLPIENHSPIKDSYSPPLKDRQIWGKEKYKHPQKFTCFQNIQSTFKAGVTHNNGRINTRQVDIGQVPQFGVAWATWCISDESV